MHKIWIFGDSFSTPFLRTKLDPWQKTYVNWKGYKPKVFGDIIADNLNYKSMYFASGGISNDFIFEKIYTNANKIKKNDIIIIGWSSINRFRLSLENKKWWNIVNSGENKWSDDDEYPDISNRTIGEILLNRELPMWKDELKKRIEFINWLFAKNRVIHWSPFKGVCEYDIFKKNPELIRDETNQEVDDTHYSELGHVQLAELMMDLLNDENELIKLNNLNRRVI